MSVLDRVTSIGKNIHDLVAGPLLENGLVPTVVDVGARNGMFMLPPTLARTMRLIGFEPNPVEYEKLVRHQTDAQKIYQKEAPSLGHFREEKFFDCALWDEESEQTFYITKGPGACTLMGQPLPLVRNIYCCYPGGNPKRNISYYDLHAQVIEEIPVHCRRLDSLLDPNDVVDFLKVDVEGGEMRVFKGAESLLDAGKVLFIRAEFQAFSYYNNHPVFGDQHTYLNSKGYRLIDLTFDQARCRRGKFDLPDECDHQELFGGDAIYILDPDRNVMSPQTLHRMALMSFALNFNSLGLSLLADAALLSQQEISAIELAIRQKPLKTLRRRLLDAWIAVPYALDSVLQRFLKK